MKKAIRMMWRLGILSIIVMALGPFVLAEQPQDFTPIDHPGAVLTVARGINPQGDIVGSYQDATGYHGFLLSGGNWTLIDVVGAVRTRPKAINAEGEVVGQYIDVNGNWHSFLLSGGTMLTIDPPGATGKAQSGAYGINAQGNVVGQFSDASGVYHGYLLQDGVFTQLPDFVEGSPWSSATEVNARGDIAGMYYAPGDPKMYGYLLRNGTFTKIDIESATTMVCPFGINERGDMVGHYFDASLHGVLWTKGVETPTPIDFPGAVSTEAIGINPRGDIVGDYTDSAGKIHGFLLRRAAPR